MTLRPMGAKEGAICVYIHVHVKLTIEFDQFVVPSCSVATVILEEYGPSNTVTAAMAQE